MAADLTTLVKCIFRNKRDYVHLEDDDKETLFFIFNRYASREHLNNANFFNRKGMDKAMAMDMWFEYFRDILSIPPNFYPPRAAKGPDLSIEGLDACDLAILKFGFANELNAFYEQRQALSDPITVIKKKGKKKKGD